MTNVEVSVDADDVLHITIDLKKQAGHTKGRQNVLIATTHGNVSLPGPNSSLRLEKLNLSVWRHRTPLERVRKQIRIEGWGDEV